MPAEPHIAILGARPGGYVAAIRAAQLGARVSVIEAQALGGVCVNWGCIPSKSLLAVVELGDIVTLPEIGRVGLTEAEARERTETTSHASNGGLKIGRFRYAALGKAQASGDTTGFCKVIAEESSGKILGVHIIGAHAADLIHEAAIAMQMGATLSQMAGMIHAHPTLAEGLMEAAEDADDKAIHQLKKKVG